MWRCVYHAASPIDYLLFSLQNMGLYVFNWPISVLGDWKDISIAHVIIIIKSEVSTFPIVIIFFRGGVPEVFVSSYSSLIAFTFRENREFVFIIIVQFMISADIRIRFGLQIVLVCLYSTPSHYYHSANLSDTNVVPTRCHLPVHCSGFFYIHVYIYIIYVLMIHSKTTTTYKMPVRYILLSVWVRLSIFSPLTIITLQYLGLHVFSLPISLVMIGRIYIYIYIYISFILISSSNRKYELLPIV